MKKWIAGIIAFLLVVICLVCIINYKTVGWLWDNWTAPTIDFDEKSEDVWDGGTSIVGLTYAEASSEGSEYLNLYIPEESEDPQLIVLVHGGGFVTNDNMSRQARLMINYFRDNGYAVASVNYRLAQEALYPAAIEDVKAAVRFLRAHADEYGYDAEDIAIWGESAGGYLAMMAAFTDDTEFNDLEYVGQDELGDVSARVSTLIDFYGVADMSRVNEDWKVLGLPHIVYTIANSWAMGYMKETGADSIEEAWIGSSIEDMTSEEKDSINPLFYLEKNIELNKNLDIWITHGTSDITVPILQSESVYDEAVALGIEDVHLEVIDGAGHADDRCYSDEQLEMISEFIKE